MGVLSDLLQTAVSAPGSRGPNISQFLGHDGPAQFKLSAATKGKAALPSAFAVDGTGEHEKGDQVATNPHQRASPPASDAPSTRHPQPAAPEADGSASNSPAEPRVKAKINETAPITCSQLQCETPDVLKACGADVWHNFDGGNVRMASSMCFCSKPTGADGDSGPQCKPWRERGSGSSATPEMPSHPGTNRKSTARDNEAKPIDCADLRCDHYKFPDACEGDWYHNFDNTKEPAWASRMCYCDQMVDEKGQTHSKCKPRNPIWGSSDPKPWLEQEPIKCAMLRCDRKALYVEHELEVDPGGGKKSHSIDHHDGCEENSYHSFEGKKLNFSFLPSKLLKKASSMCVCETKTSDDGEVYGQCKAREKKSLSRTAQAGLRAIMEFGRQKEGRTGEGKEHRTP